MTCIPLKNKVCHLDTSRNGVLITKSEIHLHYNYEKQRRAIESLRVRLKYHRNKIINRIGFITWVIGDVGEYFTFWCGLRCDFIFQRVLVSMNHKSRYFWRKYRGNSTSRPARQYCGTWRWFLWSLSRDMLFVLLSQSTGSDRMEIWILKRAPLGSCRGSYPLPRNTHGPVHAEPHIERWH